MITTKRDRALEFLEKNIQHTACFVRTESGLKSQLPVQNMPGRVVRDRVTGSKLCRYYRLDPFNELFLVLDEVLEIKTAEGQRWVRGFEVVDGGRR